MVMGGFQLSLSSAVKSLAEEKLGFFVLVSHFSFIKNALFVDDLTFAAQGCTQF